MSKILLMTDSYVMRWEDPFSSGLGGLLLIYPRLSLSLAARAFMRLLQRRYAAVLLAKLAAHPPASAAARSPGELACFGRSPAGTGMCQRDSGVPTGQAVFRRVKRSTARWR